MTCGGVVRGIERFELFCDRVQARESAAIVVLVVALDERGVMPKVQGRQKRGAIRYFMVIYIRDR